MLQQISIFQAPNSYTKSTARYIEEGMESLDPAIKVPNLAHVLDEITEKSDSIFAGSCDGIITDGAVLTC